MKKLLASLLLIPLLFTFAHADFDGADNKRKMAQTILEELRIIDAAIDQYAIENHKDQHAPVEWAANKLYLKPGTRIFGSGGKDPLGQSIQWRKVFRGRYSKKLGLTHSRHWMSWMQIL